MLQENVHKLIVCGNKSRIHNCSYKATPISQGKEHPWRNQVNGIVMKVECEDLPYARDRAMCPGDASNLILATVLLGGGHSKGHSRF